MSRPFVRPVVLAGSLAVVLLLASSAAQADPTLGGTGPTSGNLAQQAHRSVVWVGTTPTLPHGFRISSESVSAPQADEFQITYNAGSFTLDYQKEAGGPVTSSFTLAIKSLVEWMPTDGATIEHESIVDEVPLAARGFGALPIQVSDVVAPSGVPVHSFLIPSDNQDVLLNLTIAEGFVQLSGNQTLTPMEAKLTFDVTHQMVDPGARVALQLEIATSSSYAVRLQNRSWDDEYHFSEDNRAVNVTNNQVPGTSSAFFAWSNVATVNGQTGPVTVAGPEENTSALGFYDLYLEYPPPSGSPNVVQIVHDPTLGVVSAAYLSVVNLPIQAPGLQGDVSLYLMTTAAVAALVVGTAALTARRRKRP